MSKRPKRKSDPLPTTCTNCGGPFDGEIFSGLMVEGWFCSDLCMEVHEDRAVGLSVSQEEARDARDAAIERSEP